MSSIELLDRTRRIRSLLHENEDNKVSFDELCVLMGSILHCSVCLLSAKGKVLGHDSRAIYPNAFAVARGSFIDEDINARLLRVLSTRENVRLDSLGVDDRGVLETEALIAPVEMGSKRAGSLLFFRRNRGFSVDDIILCEYASTVASLELIRSLTEEEESSHRVEDDINSALDALSYTEKQALSSVFEGLGPAGGTIVASSISRDTGITRSVIVNALRKLESAGIIDTRSLGMKGTSIRILYPEIFDRIALQD
ncbi:MAG: GTP-sensing pleiotropic transcriptional regulator CodY [Lachnospiraceae bacterium]|nr:GTP-sensing pleiotropic transcriptional regulator CodY [Lachnospiraceae bacterium]